MHTWLQSHFLSFQAAWRMLLQTPLASLLNLAIIGIALSLPFALHTGVSNMQRLAERLPTNPQVTLYLTANTGPNDLERVRRMLQADTTAQSVVLVDKAAALRQLTQASGIQQFAQSLTDNPLPDAFVVSFPLGPSVADADRAGGGPFDRLSALSGLPRALPGEVQRESLAGIRQRVQRWKNDPAVSEIQFDDGWAERMVAFVALGQQIVWMVAWFFGTALFLITFNLVRMQILLRREEIIVSMLIGATDTYIRRPLLHFCAIQSVLGALIATLLVCFAVQFLNGPVSRLALQYDERFTLQFPTLASFGTMLLLVWFICLLGTLLSVRQHLRALET